MPLLPPEDGSLNTATVSDPAVGADVVFAIPAHERWRLHALAFTFTADANVAARLMRLDCYIATVLAHSAGTNHQEGATDTWLNFALAGLGTNGYSFYPHAQWSLPPRFILPPETILTITCAQKQAGDAFTDIFVTYESWIQP